MCDVMNKRFGIKGKECYLNNACSTGVCLYFGVAVIKLLSLTSSSCYQILKKSEKLKHFEMPDKDALKVVK